MEEYTVTTKNPLWQAAMKRLLKGEPVTLIDATALLGIHRNTAIKYTKMGKYGAELGADRKWYFSNERIRKEIGQ